MKPIIAEKAKENERIGAEMTNTGLQKSVNPVNTQKELSKIAGVSHDTIAKVEKIEAKATPEVKRGHVAVLYNTNYLLRVWGA